MAPIERKTNAKNYETRVRLTIPLSLAVVLAAAAILSRIILTFGTNEKFSTALSAYSDRFAAGFERIFLETLPFLLLGALAAAVVEHAFNRDEIEAIFAKSPAKGIAAGLLTALVIPVGEGGSIILARALIKKGAGIPAAAALMLAAPALNISTLAAAFGMDGVSTVVWIRMGVSVAFAVLFGLVVSVEREAGRVVVDDVLPQPDTEGEAAGTAAGKFNGGWWKKVGVTTAREFLEFVPYLIAAALAAAFLQTIYPAAWIPPAQGGFGAVAGSAGLWAFLTAYGSLGDMLAVQSSTTPWPLTAQTVFLSLGVLVDIKLLVLYSSVFRKKIVLYLAALALAAAALAGLIAGILEAGA